MAHINKVLQSVNDDDAARCVDLFVRPNGTFGFEEFRRDAEDISGWFAVGGHGSLDFASVEEARSAALSAVGWLADRL